MSDVEAPTNRIPRARKPRATKAQVLARVEHIVGLMARNEWQPWETAERLSKEWGLAHQTVENLASEASRRFQIPAEQIDARRGQLIATFGALAYQAAHDRDAVTGLAKPLDATRILETLARFAGLDPDSGRGNERPQRIEIALLPDLPPQPKVA